MKFSERWLREWVNPDISSDELMKRLTMAGLEIEAVQAAAAEFSNVVVGEVLAAERHPDADKLSVCQVTDGIEKYQVVCGASNVRAGLKVPFARVGAKIGTELTIKKAKLRGVESHGMLCSAEELGLAETAEGLLELPGDAPNGLSIRDYLQLDDALIEVNLTPNRGDCLSIAGLAREVGVLTRATVTAPEIKPVAAVTTDQLPINLAAPADCPKYFGRVIRNINPHAETPLWMQEKLRRCGLRCIDPVVDITNYVLLELGQPMHAFDHGKLTGGINVRRANAGEKLVLLDGKEVELQPDTLVIADQEKALAMAGIMGGKASAVTPRTTSIFLESAHFSPLAIAGRARRYGLHTDAAHRYERGVDFNLPKLAIERATSLLLAIAGGEAGPVTCAESPVSAVPAIELRRKRIGRLLGADIADADVGDILARLGLTELEATTEGWRFAVPSWRFDISIEADLIEELARVRGYDSLPVTAPQARLGLYSKPETLVGVRAVRSQLVGLGYQEVVTYSFVDGQLEAVLGEGTEPVALANPISQDMAVMRTNLWAGLITTLKHNQNRQLTRLRLFENGLTFLNKNKKLEQKFKVGCLIWGACAQEQWSVPSKTVDFFDLKGDVEAILGLSLNAAAFEFAPDVHQALQPGQTARIKRNDETVGWLGALHPSIQQALDIPGKVYLAELDFEAVRGARIPVVKDLSRYPRVRRDLALVVGQEITAEQLLAELKSVAGPDLQELTLFDVYQGQNIEKDKKSLALGLTFQHASRTLADADINPIIDSCIKALEAKFNAELR
ncbi:MAG: phenylalanine--tRNA ligase subunit beta [Pseudomonadota bacterium]